ncbi:Uma2 family endonuclease [Candidatus Thiosymbion oneisti]|uniref:Uma2 family endonuclease n=1 Tax=Candidatus Thiosymbion oneisti TaxID=589554 RepID=UPI000A985AB0|nr:Uma2 family endonuclease [Candidatus Thiosymbion oneisti]
MSPQAVVKQEALFTWADYRTWPDDERWELIAGVAYAMAPVPSTKHQIITGNLFGRLIQGLAGKPCRPFIAPTDVRLSDLDVVQPDILVVCNPARIAPTHIEGAPEVVIEVLSPTTSAKDLRQKKALYERARVREYLVIDPLEEYAIRFLLGADGFDKGTIFAADEQLVIATLEALEIPLWEVFELEGPRDGVAAE